jgi:CPA2 family monovalent cation:H+ antiporter-2/glutathione-regulated potassium-efflux system ancillary protein KefC
VARRRRAAFEQVEERSGEKLYQAWLEREAEESFGDNYVDLYMEVERVLDEAMKKDSDDSHDRAERGWTPPPKNYLDDVEAD